MFSYILNYGISLVNKHLYHRDFPTFLKSGQGPVEFGKKAFGSSKFGKFDAVYKNWTAI